MIIIIGLVNYVITKKVYICCGGEMKVFFVIFIGAGFGGAVRHAVNVVGDRFFGAQYATTTMLVNVVGCLLMGMLIDYLALRAEIPQCWRLFVTTGMLGGFTTFSAFSLETVLMYQRGQAVLALGYAIGSVAFSVMGLLLGMWLVH